MDSGAKPAGARRAGAFRAAGTGHRGLGVPGVSPVPAAARARPRRPGGRQLLLQLAAQPDRPSRQSPVRADPSRRHLPPVRRGGPDLPPGLPGVAGVLPARPGPDHQDLRARLHQHARAGQAARRPDPAELDLRGLRRPRRPPADRVVLGKRQPDRHPVLLRRGQAVRRDAVLRLLPPAPAADQGGPHLQHLRPEHAGQRRPGSVELHRPRPGAASP